MRPRSHAPPRRAPELTSTPWLTRRTDGSPYVISCEDHTGRDVIDQIALHSSAGPPGTVRIGIEGVRSRTFFLMRCGSDQRIVCSR